jgi:hypothetical protein
MRILTVIVEAYFYKEVETKGVRVSDMYVTIAEKTS